MLALTPETRERLRGLLTPLLTSSAADTRASLLCDRSQADEEEVAEAKRPLQGRRAQEDRAELFGSRFGLFRLTPRQIDLILSLRIDHVM